MASGHGGPGCVSFRREKYVPRGGPDGGDGGSGGDVIFQIEPRLHSLLDLKFQKKYKAKNGQPGGTQNMTGKDGEDLILKVPPGTVIKNMEKHTIKDLTEDTFVFLKGGLGGRGNTFYKGSVNQSPEVAQKGLPGENMKIHLELKLIADVGIIGFPNAGKSTVISRMSAAKPKVADYPFTTLIPNLGVVRYGDSGSYVVADMPGLIKDAHKGTGLGTRFLKHIERTSCFLHMIDASGMSGRDPWQDFEDINRELELYDELHKEDPEFVPLANRKQIVGLNKIDVLNDAQIEEIVEDFKEKGIEAVPLSAATGENVENVVFKLGDIVFNENK